MIALVAFAASQLALIVCAWTFCDQNITGGKAKAKLEPQPA